MPKIQRLTFFKIPDPSDIEKAIEAYAQLAKDQQKDGKPYILSQTAYKLKDDPRSQGYTVCARSVFSSEEDMKYYDTECAAHTDLKTKIVPTVKGGPPLMTYMEYEGPA